MKQKYGEKMGKEKSKEEKINQSSQNSSLSQSQNARIQILDELLRDNVITKEEYEKRVAKLTNKWSMEILISRLKNKPCFLRFAGGI